MSVTNSIGGNAYGPVVMAGRDARVTQVQAAAGGDPAEALDAVALLARRLGVFDLAGATEDAARRDLAEIEAELRRDDPEPAHVAGHLERLTALLKEAGALAAAGAALATPLGAIAGWLGPLGGAVLALLR